MFERKIGQLAYSTGLGRILLTILKRVNIEREGWNSISFYWLFRIEVFGKLYNNLKIHRNLEIAVSGIYDIFFVLELIPNPVNKLFLSNPP